MTAVQQLHLKEMPQEELNILTQIYEKRGLKRETAIQVAIELTEKDALGTHIREELGINEISQANPIQAAIASGASFSVGGIMPLLTVLFVPVNGMEYWLYGPDKNLPYGWQFAAIDSAKKWNISFIDDPRIINQDKKKSPISYIDEVYFDIEQWQVEWVLDRINSSEAFLIIIPEINYTELKKIPIQCRRLS